MEYDKKYDICSKGIKENLEKLNQKRISSDCLFKDIKIKCSSNNKGNKTKLNHLIAKSKYLESISKNNKVITFNDEDEEYYRFHTKIRLKDKKRANTYHVFCGKHDKALFSEIENGKTFCPDNKKQCFQFALRAFSFYFSKEIIKNEFRLSNKLFEKVGKRAVLLDRVTLSKFINCYQENIYDNLKSYTIVFDKKINFISCCSIHPFFNINGMYTGGRSTDYLFINVFPQEEKSYLVMSYFKDREKYLNKFIKEISKYIEKGVSA